MPDDSQYRVSDFVQVEKYVLLRGKVGHVWFNALYTGFNDGRHAVIYADGVQEVLNAETRIRKAKHDSEWVLL